MCSKTLAKAAARPESPPLPSCSAPHRSPAAFSRWEERSDLVGLSPPNDGGATGCFSY